ncbi:MAG: bifunctional DNA-formamidopyrimidine glycosylase/DNA-(apurinic or apyrimidinic site) lyase [Psittacicella sp.]
MPELPEVEVTKLKLTPYLLNKTIYKITCFNKNFRWPISDEIINLTPFKVLKLERKAKYIILYLDKGYIVIHLGMSGSISINKDDTQRKSNEHIELFLDNHIVLRYHDPRRFGAWLFFKNLADYKLFDKLGLEPLTNKFTPEYLFSITSRKSKAIKPLIMESSIVTGIGNIYASESLFKAKIHPASKACDIDYSKIETLVLEIKTILKDAIKQGGTSLKDFIQPNGDTGHFKQNLMVYGRGGKKCYICSSEIKQLTQYQRVSFYCSNCQKI